MNRDTDFFHFPKYCFHETNLSDDYAHYLLLYVVKNLRNFIFKLCNWTTRFEEAKYFNNEELMFGTKVYFIKVVYDESNVLWELFGQY